MSISTRTCALPDIIPPPSILLPLFSPTYHLAPHSSPLPLLFPPPLFSPLPQHTLAALCSLEQGRYRGIRHTSLLRARVCLFPVSASRHAGARTRRCRRCLAPCSAASGEERRGARGGEVKMRGAGGRREEEGDGKGR